MPKTQVIILDAREENEYNASHIEDDLFVGYNHFSLDSVFKKVPNKNDAIVVYCSVGIRSETIAQKLKKSRFIHVFNLYGGIFEWKTTISLSTIQKDKKLILFMFFQKNGVNG